jgi:tetratricopeptide (TPR) repeat protein
MSKRILYLALSVAVIGLTGCNKKLSQFKSSYFTTVPTPLETVGNTVPGNVKGTIPAKVMLKNAKVTATPILTWTANGTASEISAQPVIFQGTNVRANGQVVSYDEGGSVSIPFTISYLPAMEKSDLYLDFKVDQNGKTYSLPRVKVGYGVLATSTLASATTVTPAIAPDDFKKVITEKYTADIHFLINQANIRTNQTDKSDYIDLNKRLMEANAAANQEIAGITVNSYASPEGSLEFNTALAEKREKNTTSLVQNQLKKDKITEFGELTSAFTPEDWEGFEKLVEKSNIQDKDLIISVLKMYPDPVEREREIRNLSSVFNELADQILPQLRYSRVQAQINTLGKSDQELVDLFNSDPSKLTEEEMLYIATLTDDNLKKMEVYNTSAEHFSKDYRTFNNLGVTQFKDGDYSGARANWEHALRLNSSAKEPKMNLGLIAMMNNDYTTANQYFGAATDVPESADALGTYYLAKGDVSKAITSFGDTKTNNAALAQILNKNYTGAQEILNSMDSKDATSYYLAAIIGARTNNQNTVMNNLRQAIKLDSSLRERAQNDLEFAAYDIASL